MSTNILSKSVFKTIFLHLKLGGKWRIDMRKIQKGNKICVSVSIKVFFNVFESQTSGIAKNIS